MASHHCVLEPRKGVRCGQRLLDEDVERGANYTVPVKPLSQYHLHLHNPRTGPVVGRVVGNPEVIQTGNGRLVPRSRLVGSDLRAWHRFWTDYGALGNNPPDPVTRFSERENQRVQTSGPERS